MKARIVCEKCNEEIKVIQIHFTDIAFSKNCTVVNSHNQHPFLVEYDREYQSGNIDSIVYNCKCGETVVYNDDNDFLSGFGAIEGNIDLPNLVDKSYGKFRIEIFNKSQAGVVVCLQ